MSHPCRAYVWGSFELEDVADEENLQPDLPQSIRVDADNTNLVHCTGGHQHSLLLFASGAVLVCGCMSFKQRHNKNGRSRGSLPPVDSRNDEACLNSKCVANQFSNKTELEGVVGIAAGDSTS
jgi:alpha-tubulin suppressor-like RCC1 family protein|mmetsp:Transcript_2525/g.7914  ORF Transcript_2525/g.7914 Transcript_2525/m.7914 type:complete len:123 (-) Transcript_2525:1977-2345(-)